MLQQVKQETEFLEHERQMLIEQFKKEKIQLQNIEKKLYKTIEQNITPMSTTATVATQQTSPNPMKQSFNEQLQQQNLKDNIKTVANEIDDDDYDQVPSNDELLTTNSDTSINLILNNNNNCIMSKSANFENSLTNNNNVGPTLIKDLYQFNSNKILYKNQNGENTQQQQQSPKQQQNINKSTGSLNLSSPLLNCSNNLLDKSSNLSIISANNNQFAFKFAELEHKLALTRAENQALLEKQVCE